MLSLVAGRIIAPFGIALLGWVAPRQDAAATPDVAVRAPSERPDAAAIRSACGHAVDWLRANQNRDGSWGGARNMTYTDFWANVESHRSWTVATTGLAVMTLLELESDAQAIDAATRGFDYIVANHDLRRCDDWDIDNVWGFLYGLQALARGLADPRFAESTRRAAMLAAAEKVLARCAAYQSPNGGWGYYADQIDAWRPQWATSFTTAAMVLALLDAKGAGLAVDGKMLEGAVRAVARCRLPNGAYSYDVMAIPAADRLEGINDVRGSLCRIPVCNLALQRAGRPMRAKEIAEGFTLLFKHHRFLDCARMRPIPHEAYYYNAGYFYFFGHYYAGELLDQLPAAARAAAAADLAHEIMKTQEPSGACWDFWFADYTRAASTAFAAMALRKAARALEAEPAGGAAVAPAPLQHR